MPVRNTERYLDEALASVIAQDWRDLELLIVDDGSTDRSAHIIESACRRDGRVRLVTSVAGGLIAARNALVEAARGEYVAWMDSDDVSLPGRLRAQLDVMDSDRQLICVGTAAQRTDPEGVWLDVERLPTDHESIVAAQAHGGGVRFPTTMMRRTDVIAVGGFREPFRIGEDFDLLLRLAERGRLANLPEALYLYRQHLGSVCASLGTSWYASRELILALAKERRETGADRLQRGERVQLAMPASRRTTEQEALVYGHWADAALAARRHRTAVKYAWRSFIRRPLRPSTWRLLLRALNARFAILPGARSKRFGDAG